MCIHAGKYCFQLIKVCRMLTRTRRVTEIRKKKISGACGGGIVADVDRNYDKQVDLEHVKGSHFKVACFLDSAVYLDSFQSGIFKRTRKCVMRKWHA